MSVGDGLWLSAGHPPHDSRDVVPTVAFLPTWIPPPPSPAQACRRLSIATRRVRPCYPMTPPRSLTRRVPVLAPKGRRRPGDGQRHDPARRRRQGRRRGIMDTAAHCWPIRKFPTARSASASPATRRSARRPLHPTRSNWRPMSAYTLDGGGPGKVDVETFSADHAVVTITGVRHPPRHGLSVLINAAGRIASRLPPPAHRTPETTQGLQGLFIRTRCAERGGSEMQDSSCAISNWQGCERTATRCAPPAPRWLWPNPGQSQLPK